MKKRLIVIDGHALLHRAWHALPPLSTKDGLVVSGAYGFFMILLKAIKELKPSHLVVTFDLAGPTFRHKEYKAYKATREEKPDELYAQVPIIEEILKQMDIPVCSASGFEADDVIGTIAVTVRDQNPEVEVIIVTGDKDTLQLVNDGVSVYTLRKGMTDTVLYNPAGVEEKMGVRPDQMVDYKALRGDPSDNIPGVRGVGEKTAVDLIQRFGSLANLYKALDANQAEISDSVRRKLIEGKDDALMSQNLCRIRTDVKINFHLVDAEFKPVTREAVQDSFERYQFSRLLTQLPKSDSEEGRKAGGQLGLLGETGSVEEEEQQFVKHAWIEVKTVAELNKIVEMLKKTKRLAFRSTVLLNDNNNSSISPDLLVLSDEKVVYLISKEILTEGAGVISSLFSGHGTELICHDLKTEIRRLQTLGIEIKNRTFDLMLASYLLHAGERRHSLEAILSFLRGISTPTKHDDVSTNQLQERLVVEVSQLASLADEFSIQLRNNGLLEVFWDMEVPLAHVLVRLEHNGVGLDSKYLLKFSEELEKKIDSLTAEIYGLAGEEFNLNSPGQLKDVLFVHLGLSAAGLKKTVSGQTLSTAAAELEKIKDQHEIIGRILDYRELAKLQSTYVEALPPLVDPKTGRIHADFNQTVTATGRLSSSNPNLQNIPTAGSEYGKKVRDAFVAREGSVLLAADYSQIELRIAAHIANEQTMINAFSSGEDIHYRTAVEMFGEDKAKESRRIAKAINFGILYGMGAQRLAASTDLPVTEARNYIDQYFALHGGIEQYIQETKEKLATDGFVETIFGRKRFFPNFHLLNQRERAEAERQAVNMPIQGSSADMIKKAMINIDRLLGERYGYGDDSPVQMILQVHDELIFEAKKELVAEVAKLVTKEMESVIKLKVQITVDIKTGERWGSMEKLV
ncbi:DNA polymerase I [Candidatus Uhrbacteria bacterium RIFOXYC2_FULL_47_19]|uniref:DNA polymerase I n=1 Tax=Candidatus Uhrbacteria bacterium RIFOXYC2_FULL_47_19 TaxID=1802424 RepID=A0A1F7WEQ6_9BACT|nr:MAG: DNA polymerase I [Candidatus Uhrbacteria bacterium RIFOXYC2_FULL_47_19]HCC21974.1 DNA polymerase I [Candidatus Uhrbacteria bacterium]